MRSVNCILRARITPRLTQPVTQASSLALFPRTFSTQNHLLVQKKVDQSKARTGFDSQQSDTANPSYPAFSLEALGVSKNMKIFLLVILSIMGTIETWFWCKAIWFWWKGDSEAQKE
ncbi:hypothetical protein B0J13DRAFT_566720 [Dactylonectria estremocensis]|uniref:Uncharacterized protein n=1 Tax=Dactylonectria estremocensis TaxID=1079267 RepID=A0A9P9DR15_9HYPO|nr:hypothetical protein B0J13DRAFT_566720 [Dactylonectria estremocensis]